MAIDRTLERFRVEDDLIDTRNSLKLLFVYEPNLKEIRRQLGADKVEIGETK